MTAEAQTTPGSGVSEPRGKLGLCLSGGGFRAALYHIGTLAALAEQNMLHRVEVLSTVSGGSIIGAYFYLKVKQLLEGRRPGCPQPVPDHYLDIVKEIETEFLEAVQKNIRMRLFANPYKTALMLLDEEYSRSDRLAELLDEHFYAPLALTSDMRLKDTHIHPGSGTQTAKSQGSAVAFNNSPQNDCKIPILTINATSLNTGHPFYFTGSAVGEPARVQYALEENSNVVLPQLRFDGTYENDRSRALSDAQMRKMAQITLSDAVAASAAVPGIFTPLPIHDLYSNSKGEVIVVELSDGGVFDNQGLDALVSAGCTEVIISDACGQLEDERLLATDLLSTSQRANDVMMERIRGHGYCGLWFRAKAREYLASSPEAAAFRASYCFIDRAALTHLREVAPNKPSLPAIPGPGSGPDGLVYRMSGLRTDLDSFSDLEADALMYHGYALALNELAPAGSAPRSTPQRPWRFLGIRQVLSTKDGQFKLLTHLKVGKNQFGKAFRLAPIRSWAWLLFLLSPIVLLCVVWLYVHWSTKIILPQPDMTWSELVRNIVIAALALLPISPKVRAFFKTVPWLRVIKENPATNAVSAVLSVLVMVLTVFLSLGMLVALQIFNGIFLRLGQRPGESPGQKSGSSSNKTLIEGDDNGTRSNDPRH